MTRYKCGIGTGIEREVPRTEEARCDFVWCNPSLRGQAENCDGEFRLQLTDPGLLSQGFEKYPAVHAHFIWGIGADRSPSSVCWDANAPSCQGGPGVAESRQPRLTIEECSARRSKLEGRLGPAGVNYSDGVIDTAFCESGNNVVDADRVLEEQLLVDGARRVVQRDKPVLVAVMKTVARVIEDNHVARLDLRECVFHVLVELIDRLELACAVHVPDAVFRIGEVLSHLLEVASRAFDFRQCFVGVVAEDEGVISWGSLLQIFRFDPLRRIGQHKKGKRCKREDTCLAQPLLPNRA